MIRYNLYNNRKKYVGSAVELNKDTYEIETIDGVVFTSNSISSYISELTTDQMEDWGEIDRAMMIHRYGGNEDYLLGILKELISC